MQGDEQDDGERGEEHDGRVGPRRLELAARGVDHVAEARARAGVLGQDGADDGDDDGDPRAGERARQRRGRLDAAEGLQARGAERAS